MNIVIDKLHYKGHTDAWCKKHCDPCKFGGLKKVCASMAYQRIVYVTYIYNLGCTVWFLAAKGQYSYMLTNVNQCFYQNLSAVRWILRYASRRFLGCQDILS